MTSPLQDLPPLRDVIEQFDLLARKSLGQHFLLDLNLTDRIVRSAGDLHGITVIEIGPGPGGLTRSLLKTDVAHVIAIEKDDRFLGLLKNLAVISGGRLVVLHQDALTINYESLGTNPRAIVANLPYNVGTPLLIKWLSQSENFCHMTLMFQKEVAERIVARPGSKAYGRLAVMSQWRCNADLVFTVPARAFTPPPQVDSAIVRLVPKTVLKNDPVWTDMETITAAAFNQRRKMLRASLRGVSPKAEVWLETCHIDPTARAEMVDIEGFVRLAKAWPLFKK